MTFQEESEDQQIYQEFLKKYKKILSNLPDIQNNNQKNKENSPIDEETIKKMIEKYNFGLKREEIRIVILSNKHNDITTIYYLLLNNRIKKGKKSLCDLKSNEFKKYIQNKENLFEKYEFDIKKLIEERKKGLFINNFYSNIGTNKNSSSHIKTPKFKNRNINSNYNNSNNIKVLKNYKINFQIIFPNSNIMKKNYSKNLFHSGSKPSVSKRIVNKNLFSLIPKKPNYFHIFQIKIYQIIFLYFLSGFVHFVDLNHLNFSYVFLQSFYFFIALSCISFLFLSFLVLKSSTIILKIFISNFTFFCWFKK